MPTNRRRRPCSRRSDVEALTFNQMLDLLTGTPYFEGFDDDVDAMSDAWDAHADRILAAWIPRFPGTRPFAAWLFDLVPEHGERRVLDDDYARLTASYPAWRTHGILHTDLEPPIQEEEATYLARNHLLTDAEAGDLATGRGERPVCPTDMAAELAGGGW